MNCRKCGKPLDMTMAEKYEVLPEAAACEACVNEAVVEIMGKIDEVIIPLIAEKYKALTGRDLDEADPHCESSRDQIFLEIQSGLIDKFTLW